MAVSETMRLAETGHRIETLWDPSENRIVVRRDVLRGIDRYAGVLLREAAKALTGIFEATAELEEEMARVLDVMAAAGLGRAE